MAKSQGFCPTIVKIKLKNNTVFPSQKEMDRVGVEPTTSAHSILSQSAIDGKLVQIPPSPFFCA